MAGTLRVRRSRGAFSGALLILLGLWGGLAPLIGPLLHFAYTPDRAWTVTSGRIWLEFIPAAIVVVGGLMMLASQLRPWAMFGAWMAVVGGGWFALGNVVAKLWMHTPPAQGTPVGGPVIRALEELGFFAGLGALIICIAAIALGRLSVISVRDASLADRALPATPVEPLPVREPLADRDRIPFSDDDAESTAQLRKPTTSTSRTPMATLSRIASRNKPVKESGDDSSAGDDSRSLSRTGSSASSDS
ncbi:MAG TPA: hypothetical protein VGM14_14825 [Streptosporangiaceae bacterium]|jgi:hypothetical protein